MASYTPLANLRTGRCSNTAEVRLLRFWEAQNIRKGGELMSLDMLLLDEQSTLIQGTVNAARLDTYRELFVEGSVYSLSGFDVTRSDNKFRLSDAPVSIRFTDAGNVVIILFTELFLTTCKIYLELSAIRSTINNGTQGSNVNVCVSLFDGLAFAFAEKMTRNGREPKVVLITSINPKVVGGRLFLNGTSGTHIYFDSQLQAKNAIHSELFGDGSNQISSSSKLIHAQKIVPLTVSELNQYVLSADPQVIEFLCTAKVTGIQFEEECAVASLRYRVELSVADNTGDAVFVAFDLDMAKLTNIPAAEAAEVIIKLGEFNFTFKHQTFTISRIFSVAQRAPLPDFVGDGAQHDPNDGLQVQNPISSLVPVCNSSTIVETSGGMAAELGASTDKEDQTSSSAAPVEGPSATSTPPVEADESKNKKPRLA
ncbi:hypothetical protein YC2023_017843 [Brassica napus]